MPRTFRKKDGSIWKFAGIAALMTVVILAVATVFFVAPTLLTGQVPTIDEFKWWEVNGATPPTSVEQTALSGQYAATDEVAFRVGKLWGGSVWSTTGNIAIYNVDDYTNPIEILDLDSNAVATTTWQYTTGNTYALRIYNDAGSEDMWTTWTVPGKSGLTDTVITAPLRMFNAPTIAFSVIDSAGTTYTNGENWNITTGASPGYETGQFTINVRNTAANTGFVESTNPIYNINYKACLVITLSGTNFDYIIPNGPFNAAVPKSSMTYYIVELDPSMLTRIEQGYTIIGGFQEIPITMTINTGVGDDADIDLDFYMYTNARYIQDNSGSFGPIAYNAAGSNCEINVLD